MYIEKYVILIIFFGLIIILFNLIYYGKRIIELENEIKSLDIWCKMVNNKLRIIADETIRTRSIVASGGVVLGGENGHEEGTNFDS